MRHVFEDFVVDTATRELFSGGNLVPIEPKAFDLLVHMIDNRHQVVTRDDMVAAVWDGRFISDAAISSAVSALRRALGDDGQEQRLVRTVRGRGFRFVGTLAAPPATTTEPMSAAELEPAADVALPTRPSIAVIPFSTMGADSGRFVALGLTSDTTVGLARTRWLFVAAMASARRLAQAGLDTIDIANRLGVRYALSGIVQEHAGRIRLSVTLTDAVNGIETWAETFERRLDDIFAIQTEVAGLVISGVEAEIELRERQRAIMRPIESLDAWSAYHQATDILYKFRLGEWDLAADLLARAARLDPGFARVPAAQSFLHWQRQFLHLDAGTGDSLARARDFALQSLDLDPLDPQAHWAVGRVALLGRDHGTAQEALQKSIDLNPNFANGHYSLSFAKLLGQASGFGLKDCRTAGRISPYDPMRFAFYSQEASALAHKGELDHAAQVMERALQQPNHHHQVIAIAVWLFQHTGRTEQARRCAADLKRHRPGYTQADFFRAFPYVDEAYSAVSSAFSAAGIPATR